MKKVFILTQFGTPHSWTQQYLDNVAHLEKDGWYWKIFTSNTYERVPSNVEVIPMTTDQFNDLTEKKLGIRPNIYMTEKGVPSVHVTDFCIMWGIIFEDYLKDADYWGMPNWDCVYGNLSKFIPDSEIEQSDVWTDDVATINGVFCLFRNTPEVNSLFKMEANWQDVVAQKPCPACCGTAIDHMLYGSDEYGMTTIMRRSTFRFKYPPYYPMLSHDRLEQHVPNVKLSMKADNSLWELYGDTKSPNWIHERPFIGREIPYFHFIRTKTWPL